MKAPDLSLAEEKECGYSVQYFSLNMTGWSCSSGRFLYKMKRLFRKLRYVLKGDLYDRVPPPK